MMYELYVCMQVKAIIPHFRFLLQEFLLQLKHFSLELFDLRTNTLTGTATAKATGTATYIKLQL